MVFKSLAELTAAVQEHESKEGESVLSSAILYIAEEMRHRLPPLTQGQNNRRAAYRAMTTADLNKHIEEP